MSDMQERTYYPFMAKTGAAEPSIIRGMVDFRGYFFNMELPDIKDGAPAYQVYLKSAAGGSSSSLGETVFIFEFAAGTTAFEIPFMVTSGQGLGRLTSSGSSYSCSLFIDSDTSYDGDYTDSGKLYEIEPGCIICSNRRVNRIVFLNEERRWNPVDRSGLAWTEVCHIDKDSYRHISLRNGYNADVRSDGTFLQFSGSPGAGQGQAPYNQWDDPPPGNLLTEGVLSINGISPDSSGIFKVDTSRTVTKDTQPGKADFRYV